MPSCNTYHLTWASLTLGVGYLFMAVPAKRSGCSSKAKLLLLTLDEGYLLIATPPDHERGVAPLSPLVPTQPLLLGHGVAGILSAAFSQHHLSRFEIAQLEFHHLH